MFLIFLVLVLGPSAKEDWHVNSLPLEDKTGLSHPKKVGPALNFREDLHGSPFTPNPSFLLNKHGGFSWWYLIDLICQLIEEKQLGCGPGSVLLESAILLVKHDTFLFFLPSRNLSNNRITTLEVGAFDNLSGSLIVLKLNRNKISAIQPKSLKLPNLQHL